MKNLYAYSSDAGTFYIRPIRGYYMAMLEHHLIDSFSTPEGAARTLAVSRDMTLPSNVTFDQLKIPADLHQWQRIQ